MGLGGLARGAPRCGRLLFALLVVATLSAGCGGEDGTSPSELRSLLIPVRDFPVQVDRVFEWEDPTDFTVQGLSLPEGTDPSEAAAAIDDAGFEAAAGKLLSPNGGEPKAHEAVVLFESEHGAGEALDYLHSQDLARPCSACGVIARPMRVVGIPNAKGTHQAPATGETPSGPIFERYVIEFTVGPYLFVGRVTGQPGIVAQAAFSARVKDLYEHARRRAR